MLLYKNHRFHCEGVSFEIPDGYCLETNYEESPEDTIHLWSVDERIHLCIGIERETKGPMQSLEQGEHKHRYLSFISGQCLNCHTCCTCKN